MYISFKKKQLTYHIQVIFYRLKLSNFLNVYFTKENQFLLLFFLIEDICSLVKSALKQNENNKYAVHFPFPMLFYLFNSKINKRQSKNIQYYNKTIMLHSWFGFLKEVNKKCNIYYLKFL